MRKQSKNQKLTDELSIQRIFEQKTGKTSSIEALVPDKLHFLLLPRYKKLTSYRVLKLVTRVKSARKFYMVGGNSMFEIFKLRHKCRRHIKTGLNLDLIIN